jgi:hypothetical protein
MRVARLIDGTKGPLDLPESLREMRNFVHPAAMKSGYLPEHDLLPEATAAEGFLLQSCETFRDDLAVETVIKGRRK